MVAKEQQTNWKNEHILFNQRGTTGSEGLENVFNQVHNLLFTCLTDNIQNQHIFF